MGGGDGGSWHGPRRRPAPVRLRRLAARSYVSSTPRHEIEVAHAELGAVLDARSLQPPSLWSFGADVGLALAEQYARKVYAGSPFHVTTDRAVLMMMRRDWSVYRAAGVQPGFGLRFGPRASKVTICLGPFYVREAR
jgi:hypothetical protein